MPSLVLDGCVDTPNSSPQGISSRAHPRPPELLLTGWVSRSIWVFESVRITALERFPGDAPRETCDGDTHFESDRWNRLSAVRAA
jgi:hypothetical protein